VAEPSIGLPSGTVTFVFSDIEGSTKLLEELGDHYADLLATYREVTEKAVADNGGVIFGSEGDGVFMAFSGAASAAESAHQAQVGYRAAAWPGGKEVRVRMGVHTGSPVLIGDDYTGIDVHRAARITAAAWGGQVLMSEATKVLIESTGVVTRDLGWYAMKGLSRPERLFQMEGAGLDSAFPPPRARSREVNLPSNLTSLVGRDADVTAVVQLFEQEGSRLVTLSGPGGIGKTRLAVAVAARMDPTLADGVAYVDLTALDEPDQVATKIASDLGVPDNQTTARLEGLAAHLQGSNLLLVLDGFERVVPAAPNLATLLARCPGLMILVTSRAVLDLPVEREFRVGPLEVPAGGDTNGDPNSYASVRLFIDRAKSIRPDFELTPAGANAITTLVRRLDGLPLAIEIAAARTRVLAPEALLERLGASIDLSSSARDLPDRQRSVRATIEWSHDLLSDDERRLFAHLGVFTGGWTLEAAEAVCQMEELGGTLAGLESLLAQSLLQLEPDGRMHMLSPIREFSQERLSTMPEAEEIRSRHARFFVELAEAAEPALRDSRQRDTFASLGRDWRNELSAMDWAIDRRRFDIAASIVTNTWVFSWQLNQLASLSVKAAQIYEHDMELDPPLRSRLQFVAAGMYAEMGEHSRSVPYGRRAIETAIEAGQPATEAWAHMMLAAGLAGLDALDPEIGEHVEASVTLAEQEGDPFLLAYAYSFRGSIFGLAGDIPASLHWHSECLRLARSLDSDPLIAQALSQLAITQILGADLAGARQSLLDAGDSVGRLQSLEIIAYHLDAAAWLAFLEEDPVRAMTALGAAEASRARSGISRWATVEMIIGETAMAMESMDPELRKAKQAGAAMRPHDALALALARHHESSLTS
jgi:predicted ATPase/class 3 adenylate cyclase